MEIIEINYSYFCKFWKETLCFLVSLWDFNPCIIENSSTKLLDQSKACFVSFECSVLCQISKICTNIIIKNFKCNQCPGGGEGGNEAFFSIIIYGYRIHQLVLFVVYLVCLVYLRSVNSDFNSTALLQTYLLGRYCAINIRAIQQPFYCRQLLPFLVGYNRRLDNLYGENIFIKQLLFYYHFWCCDCRERKIPIIVRRYLPDGSYEDWAIDELIITDTWYQISFSVQLTLLLLCWPIV